MSRRTMRSRAVVGLGTPLVLVAVVLLALYTITIGALPPSAGPVYSVAQVTAGLQMHPRQWAGRAIAVQGVAARVTPDGFMLFDHALTPSNPSSQTIWVSSTSRTWRIEAMVWTAVIARFVPGMGWLDSQSHAAVYRLRLTRTPCLQGDQCPSELVH